MTTWWRAYAEAAHDPKLQTLPAELFRTWFNLLCFTCVSGGKLSPIKHLAYQLRLSEDETRKRIDDLIEAGLFEETKQGLRPHNWNGRQFKSDSSSNRVKAFRERQRNVSVTPPEQSRTDTDTESKKEGAPRPNQPEKNVEIQSTDGPDTSYADISDELWNEGPVILDSLGVPGEKARKMIGKWLKGTAFNGVDRPEVVLAALRAAERAVPGDPIPWIVRVLSKHFQAKHFQGAGNGSVPSYNEAALERIRRRLHARASQDDDGGISADEVLRRFPDAGGGRA